MDVLNNIQPLPLTNMVLSQPYIEGHRPPSRSSACAPIIIRVSHFDLWHALLVLQKKMMQNDLGSQARRTCEALKIMACRLWYYTAEVPKQVSASCSQTVSPGRPLWMASNLIPGGCHLPK